MAYLKYRITDGYVVEISDTAPSVTGGYLIAQSDQVKSGDEFTYYTVVRDVDENGIVTSMSQVLQAPPAQYLLEQLANKEAEILTLKEQLKVTQEALDFIIMNGGM